MRRVLMAALAATAISLGTPALADPNGATFKDYNGPDLTTAIHASGSNLTNDAPTVYGSTTWPVGQDTPFTGYSSATVTGGVLTGTTTNIHITGGSGFAAISDADFDNKTPSTQNLFALIMDPPSFTDYEFSIQLASAGDISLYVMLTGSSVWQLVTDAASIHQNANQNNQYLLSGLTVGSFDKVLITSTGAIFEVKQNSINLGVGQVPEPATWAMMLLGFGGIGMAMRRGRKTNRLAQVA